MLRTCVTTSPSPVIVRYANWKASAVPQMSAPAPRTVNDPPLPLDEPAAPTLPISRAAQPLGTLCALAAVDVARATATRNTSHEVRTPRVKHRFISYTVPELRKKDVAWKRTGGSDLCGRLFRRP